VAALVNIGDTIAAIATARGRGAIGIVKISGPDAASILHRIFEPGAWKGGTADGVSKARRLRHGWIRHPVTGERIDEVLASWMPGPHSYSGEDVAEINGHGGGQALTALLEAVISAGARLAEPGEFTRRALLNGRIDLTQAEAVADLIDARSQKALKLAGRRLDGELRRQVEALRQEVLDVRSRIEAEIDFGDQVEVESDLQGLAALIREQMVSRIERWIAQCDAAKGYVDGVRLAVVGRPNVGKSSLINRITKKEKVIVTEIPGTTRDLVEVSVSLGGMPITITDTAGLHESQDPVERIGIQRTERYLDECEMVVFMVDAAAGISSEDLRIGEMLSDRKVVVVQNKMDLLRTGIPPKVPEGWSGWPAVAISAKHDENLSELEDILVREIEAEDVDPGGDVVPNMRQQGLLCSCLERLNAAAERLGEDKAGELGSIELGEGIGYLDQILGRCEGADVMDQIFQRFCIGK
jgi:tRNA modification GTPase